MPAKTELVETILVTAKSATGTTVATTDAELSVKTTSASAEFTLTVFVMESARTGLTVIVTVAVSLLARLPTSHVTIPFVCVQLP